jgi:hypothetical protein
MTSRQHSVPSFYKTRKTRSATAIAAWEGAGMAVWFMSRLLCEEFALFRAGIATDPGKVGTPTDTTDNRRDNALRTRERAHALKHGGAMN